MKVKVKVKVKVKRVDAKKSFHVDEESVVI